MPRKSKMELEEVFEDADTEEASEEASVPRSVTTVDPTPQPKKRRGRKPKAEMLLEAKDTIADESIDDAVTGEAIAGESWTPNIKKGVAIPPRSRVGKWQKLALALEAGDCIDNLETRQAAIGLVMAIRSSGGKAKFRQLPDGCFAVWKVE